MRGSRTVTGALLSVVLVVGAAACGVPGSGGLETIDPADVPFGLPSSTTTSTTTTTIVPSTTLPAPSTTAAEQTTSTIAQEPVQLYFPSGNRLRAVTAVATAPATASQMIPLLLNGPPPGVGLREVIPNDAEIMVDTSDGGIATVNLPANIFDGLTPNDQRLLVGQIVLTILSSVRGVGQVTFTLAEEPLSVYLGNANRSEPGQALTRADYEQLITETEPPQITTTSDAPESPDATDAAEGSGGSDGSAASGEAVTTSAVSG